MKILVNLQIPAISRDFDIFVPTSLKVRNIISLLAYAAGELSGREYVMSGMERLYSFEKNIAFRSNMTLEQYGIKNGEHLILL